MCDIQQMYDRVFGIAAFDRLFLSICFIGLGGITIFMGFYQGSHIFSCHSPHVLPMCEIDGQVGVLHMGRSGLYNLLPGGHHGDHLADIVGINMGNFP